MAAQLYSDSANTSVVSLLNGDRVDMTILLPLPKQIIEAEEGLRRPATLRQYYNDPHWKKFVTYYLQLAKDKHQSINHLGDPSSHINVSDDDRRKLNQDYKDLCEKAIRYQAAVDSSIWPIPSSEVYTMADQIEILVKRYLNRLGSSLSRARAVEEARNKIERDKEQEEKEMEKALQRLKLIEELPKGPYGRFAKQRRTDASFHFGDRDVAHVNLPQHEGTFNAIMSWLDGAYHEGIFNRDGERRVFWLQGNAHCGKSAIAHHFAEECSKRRAFAGGYIFSARDDKAFLARHFLATIMVEVADLLGDDFKLLLNQDCGRLIAENSNDFFELSPAKQFIDLVVKSYSRLKPKPNLPLLVILDDVDRCEELWSIHRVFKLIEATLDPEAGFPIYYMISSRPTSYINQWMKNHQSLVLSTTVQSPLPERSSSQVPAPVASDEEPAALEVPQGHDLEDVVTVSGTSESERTPNLPHPFVPIIPQRRPFESLVPISCSRPYFRPREAPPYNFPSQLTQDQSTKPAAQIPEIHIQDVPQVSQSHSSKSLPAPAILPETSSAVLPLPRYRTSPRPGLLSSRLTAAPVEHLDPVEWSRKTDGLEDIPSTKDAKLMVALMQIVRDGCL
ncbi:hypothetical protein BKA70DRAFT_1147110 [Coprinopsis sp. MPI-PUGE-AT-0042]|nr:hypothetical protein BKA70DRAFT_1147110 [Coprinopsis sp. MPI-PUGE-AT-0042]